MTDNINNDSGDIPSVTSVNLDHSYAVASPLKQKKSLSYLVQLLKMKQTALRNSRRRESRLRGVCLRQKMNKTVLLKNQ